MRASLAAVVVLPEPCKPISMITVGGCGAHASRCPLPPSSSTSSSWTTFTTCWAGVSDLRTSWPIAFSRTRSTKPRTTLKLTSASSRATRTSRSASWMLSSVSRPWPPRRSKIDCSLALKESNMERRSLRNYAEHFNSWPSERRPKARRARDQVLGCSATTENAHANRLPLHEQQHETEGQQQRAHGEPEIELAPAGPPIPSPKSDRSQESHARSSCPCLRAIGMPNQTVSRINRLPGRLDMAWLLPERRHWRVPHQGPGGGAHVDTRGPCRKGPGR